MVNKVKEGILSYKYVKRLVNERMTKTLYLTNESEKQK